MCARLTGASVAGASPVWERVNHPPSHEPCVVRREAQREASAVVRIGAAIEPRKQF